MINDIYGDQLPEDYSAQLQAASLVPLWPSLNNLLPRDKPNSNLHAAKWDYSTLRPLLLRSAEITSVEDAERRVLVLEHPKNESVGFRVAPSLYAGFQIILPGEEAVNHKHTPLAVRFAVEGRGAYTVVDGVKCMMEPGDLILTPPGLWHEHGHEGEGPAIWLDILNLPLVYYMGCSYSVEGDVQSSIKPFDSSSYEYVHAGLLPRSGGRHDESKNKCYPMFRYPWVNSLDALHKLSEEREFGQGVFIDYVNPETGLACLEGYRCTVIMLRPNESVKYKSSAGSAIVQIVSGQGASTINGCTFEWRDNDSLSFSSFAEVEHVNDSEQPAYLFCFDDSILMKYLNICGEL